MNQVLCGFLPKQADTNLSSLASMVFCWFVLHNEMCYLAVVFQDESYDFRANVKF